MPRENITNGSSFHINAHGAMVPEDSGCAVDELLHPQLTVHWSRPEDEGCVQVSLELDPIDLKRYFDSADLSSGKTVPIYTDALSRSQVDRMIKTLKRVRKNAFRD